MPAYRFCILAAVVALRGLFDGSPGFVIDAAGIVDHSAAISIGRIFWCEMTGVRAVQIRHARLLAIDVVDPRRHIEAQGGSYAGR